MKSILLIGVGGFGQLLAREMSEMNHQIMAVDRDEEKINEVLPYVTSAQIGECTSQKFLDTLGVKNYDVCFVTVGEDFQTSLETTSLLKEMGAKKVISRAATDIQEKFLLRNGADMVIYPEKQVARWAAVSYTSEAIEDYIRLDEKHAIFEVNIPREWQGKSVEQLDIRRRHQLNILAIKKNGKIGGIVTPETVLESDMTMLVMGEYKPMMKLFKK